MLYTFPKYVQYLPYFYKCVQYLLLLCIYNVSLLCKYNINIQRSLENKQKQKQDQTKLVYFKKKKKKKEATHQIDQTKNTIHEPLGSFYIFN